MSLGTLGYAFVLLGLGCAAFGMVVGLVNGLRKRATGARWAFAATFGFGAFMLAANLTMEFALLTHDFSVSYVAQVGSTQTPTIFTIVSLWSALEGSILFWGLILARLPGGLRLDVTAREDPVYMSLALGVMLAVATFFAFLIAGPANPFEVLPNPPPDGPGPNPLLQNHVLMVVHPPMLYLGYVGMTVPFGVAMAALLKGEIGSAWMVPLRRWTLIAWTFLTVGIILGGWWAYAVLGWGGYWAWDPVENASFLPWLTATAFIHSTMVQERKRMLKLWTISLALASFVLTILGTFMTRSGVFNSVHSFTQSDIGPTFLVFIGVLLVACIGLLAVRGHLLVAEENISSPVSREMTILLNNLVFAALTFVVLVGTLHPLIAEGLFNKRVSVGAPYFDRLTLPFWVATLFLMGVGPMLPWGSADRAKLRGQFLLPASAAAVVVVIATPGGGAARLLSAGGLRAGGVRDGHHPARALPAGAHAHARQAGGVRRGARRQRGSGPAALRRVHRAPGDRDHRRGGGRILGLRDPHLGHAGQGRVLPAQRLRHPLRGAQERQGAAPRVRRGQRLGHAPGRRRGDASTCRG